MIALRCSVCPRGRGRWPPHHRPRFSSHQAPGDSTLMLEGSTSESLGKIVRHGQGDSVITLNVGGKAFDTLKSTVAANPVLADHVARALRNREKSTGGVIFIDRDPTHFAFILQYLRNRVEFMGGDPSMKKTLLTNFCRSHTHIPKDETALRELYIEATYYRIAELQSILTEKSFLTKLLRFFDGNPFDTAEKTMARIRTWLLTLTTLSATGVTVMIQRDYDAFLKFIGWRDKDASTTTEPA